MSKVSTRGAGVLIRTIKDSREKFGRYLGVVMVGDENVNEWLVAEGHAKRYPA